MGITLIDKISSPESLQSGWDQLYKFNKGSHGLSGMTISNFQANKDDKLKSISEQLKSKKYNFSSTRGVLIPKGGNKGFRPLQIPEISDRVVIKSIAIELEEIFQETINLSLGYSFAYQKKLGIKDALLKIKEYYNLGYTYALEADLKNFFGTVDKQSLLTNLIFPNLPDDTLNALIESALNQKIGNLDSFSGDKQKYFDGVNKGIPQGNALSPFLSNIYLSKFDIEMIKLDYKLVRYADDFVILCKDETHCIEAYEASKKILESLKLEIHPLEKNGKTKINRINIDKLTFLSVTFDGRDFYPSRENFDRLVNKIWELNKDLIIHDLVTYLKKLYNKTDGWISAFIYTDLARYSDELDMEINRAIYHKLNKIYWKLSKLSISKIPAKYSTKQSSRECIAYETRLYSGIPLIQEMIKEKTEAIQRKEKEVKQHT